MPGPYIGCAEYPTFEDSTFHSHLCAERFYSPQANFIEKSPLALQADFFLEQGTGVEPASEAWEATIIADILTLHQR